MLKVNESWCSLYCEEAFREKLWARMPRSWLPCCSLRLGRPTTQLYAQLHRRESLRSSNIVELARHASAKRSQNSALLAPGCSARLQVDRPLAGCSLGSRALGAGQPRSPPGLVSSTVWRLLCWEHVWRSHVGLWRAVRRYLAGARRARAFLGFRFAPFSVGAAQQLSACGGHFF